MTCFSMELDCLQERDRRHKEIPLPSLMFEPNGEANCQRGLQRVTSKSRPSGGSWGSSEFCLNKRIRQIFPVFSFLVVVTMASSSLSAQLPPIINSLSVPSSVREMGIVIASVSASDPDGDTITYTWSFESDPTGQAHFFDLPTAGYSKTLSGSNKKLVIFGVGAPEGCTVLSVI